MGSNTKRSGCFLCALVAVLVLAWGASADAQGLPGIGSFDFAGMRIAPNVRAGYQVMGLNFNLPTRSGIQQGDGSTAIDVQLVDAHLWVGSVGIDAQLTPVLSLFGNAEANAKRTTGAVTNDDPLRHQTAFGGLTPFRWDASQLEWWAVEGGLGYRVLNDMTLVAGLRRDHLSFGLNNPRDASGNGINFSGRAGPLTETLTAAADFQLKLWVPYLGLRFTGNNYRASVSWSPFVNATVKLPNHFVSDVRAVVTEVFFGRGWEYSMSRPGTQIEGDFEYDARLSSNLSVKLWATGSWLKVQGNGNLKESVGVDVTPPQATFPRYLLANDSAPGTLARYLIATGLGAEVNF